ncbi:hypothetical protein F5Y15DRAFT_109850 [Xylariaceae sp. FL0016]|nr:hypothetical protein F5Y15DRAFT_109850 [Xylariaceae sp. FL0016]
MAPSLPPFAPFPEAPWRDHVVPIEWEACLGTWVALAEAYLSLSEKDLERHAVKEESLSSFLHSFMQEVAASNPTILGTSQSATSLLRQCFYLTSRLCRLSSPPPRLLAWEFLSDFCRVYGKKRTANLIDTVCRGPGVETSLQALKKTLIISLDTGLKGDLKLLESRLKRLHHLIHASPHAASFFLAGSDFIDGLISCFTVMNPPLRKAIITTAYLCLIGLTESDPPKVATLSDQLYALKAAADAHKAGPLNANGNMVAELVTAAPLLKQIQRRLGATDTSSTRMKSVISALEQYRKPGGSIRPKKLVKRKIDKGKGIAKDDADDLSAQMHVHRMSQISQIQDLFSDLGSGFISRLLDEYQDNNEQVIAHLLEDSLPPHLATADRTEELSTEKPRRKSHSIAPRSTPPQLPTRHNIFDDDELDQLAVDTAKLHFGKRNPEKTADEILRDRSTAPNKAAILSALSAFDADDDERDDTYDAADAGFVVNDAHVDDTDDQKRKDANEETLFRAFQSDPKSFDRDAATRRSETRTKLKQTTGMTDEAIEGWAVMLGRSPAQMKHLKDKYSAFSGYQTSLASTAWRASPAGSGAEESEVDGGPSNFRGNRSRGPGRGRGRGRGGGRGGNVAGPSGDKDTEAARRRKEANKGSKANHNRRDQRAKKMGRGGFPG